MTSQARFAGIETPVEDLATEALGILQTAKAVYRPVKTFVLLSGGNDSTTLSQLQDDLRGYNEAEQVAIHRLQVALGPYVAHGVIKKNWEVEHE